MALLGLAPVAGAIVGAVAGEVLGKPIARALSRARRSEKRRENPLLAVIGNPPSSRRNPSAAKHALHAFSRGHVPRGAVLRAALEGGWLAAIPGKTSLEHFRDEGDARFWLWEEWERAYHRKRANPDEDLRELHRRASAGDEGAKRKYLAELLRRGLVAPGRPLPKRKVAKAGKQTRASELQRLAAERGYFVATYSPGDGVTRYRFFALPVSRGQDYFGPASGDFTALGIGEARDWLLGGKGRPPKQPREWGMRCAPGCACSACRKANASPRRRRNGQDAEIQQLRRLARQGDLAAREKLWRALERAGEWPPGLKITRGGMRYGQLAGVDVLYSDDEKGRFDAWAYFRVLVAHGRSLRKHPVGERTAAIIKSTRSRKAKRRRASSAPVVVEIFRHRDQWLVHVQRADGSVGVTGFPTYDEAERFSESLRRRSASTRRANPLAGLAAPSTAGRRSNPSVSTEMRLPRRFYKGSVSFAEACRMGAPHLDGTARAFRRFHGGLDPDRDEVLVIDDGRPDKETAFLIGETPEITYDNVPEGSDKEGSPWGHKTNVAEGSGRKLGKPTYIAYVPRTGMFHMFGGTKAKDWLRG